MSTNTYFRHYVIHYTAKTLRMICGIDYRCDVSLWIRVLKDIIGKKKRWDKKNVKERQIIKS